MELTKTAEEILVSAQMLRLGAKRHKSLCVEHLFYGLMTLSRYLDPPMNKPQFEQDGAAVRLLIAPKMRSIESARSLLEQDAARAEIEFLDAASYIGRALEIAENAGKPAIDAVSFAMAILEKPSPEIRALYYAEQADLAQLDAKYPAPVSVNPTDTVIDNSKEEEGVLSEQQQKLERKKIEQEHREKERLEKEKLEKDRLEKDKLEKEKLEKDKLEKEKLEKDRLEKEKLEREKLERDKLEKERIEKERIEKEKRDRAAAEQEKQAQAAQNRSEKKPTSSNLSALLALLEAYEVENHTQSKHGVLKRKDRKAKRYTKLGAFTYRGGIWSAAIQYFLFGLLIPIGLLYVLDRFTGVFSNPPTLFVKFLVFGFIVYWMYYILRGVVLLIGRANLPLQHFLDLILFGALLFGIARGYALSYNFIWIPTWLKIVLSVVWLLTLVIGSSLYSYLVDQQDMTKTRILFQNVEGTPSMIFFRFLTRQLILPLLIVSFFWIFPIDVPDWLLKVFDILVFFWLWNVLFTMLQCVNLRYEESTRAHRGKVLAGFLLREHLLTLPFALVFFLHWLFQWFPMQDWVVAIIGVYGFIWLGLSLYYLLWLIKEEQ